MKRAVSVSLGSPARDKRVVVAFAGEEVQLERIGTGGDAHRARALFAELDGQVDAPVYELYGLTDEEIRIVEESV